MTHGIKKCSSLFTPRNSLSLPLSTLHPTSTPAKSASEKHISSGSSQDAFAPFNQSEYRSHTGQHGPCQDSGAQAALRSQVPNFLPPPLSVRARTRSSRLLGLGALISERMASTRWKGREDWDQSGYAGQSWKGQPETNSAERKRRGQDSSHNLHHPPPRSQPI